MAAAVAQLVRDLKAVSCCRGRTGLHGPLSSKLRIIHSGQWYELCRSAVREVDLAASTGAHNVLIRPGSQTLSTFASAFICPPQRQI